MHDLSGKAVPIVRAITKGLVGGSSTTAQVDRFFIFDDPPLGIYYPEASTDLQGAAFIHFKKRFDILHLVGN
jgi:hypothetical protein